MGRATACSAVTWFAVLRNFELTKKGSGVGKIAGAVSFAYRRSRLAAAVSREQLREGSAPSNRNFDSTTAEVCVTVKHGLRLAVRVARPDPLAHV